MKTNRRIVVAASLTIALLSAASGAAPPPADKLNEAAAAILRKDYPAAVRLLEPLAAAGNPIAQTRLGLLYYHGHGVRESDAMALRWFERAARQGHAEAQFHLANLHAYGLSDPAPGQDPQRLAAQWYFEAARQGHAQAQYSLGILFITGSGVQPSLDEANKWISRAAAQGHADAKLWTQQQQRR